jgi:hypothetical protein
VTQIPKFCKPWPKLGLKLSLNFDETIRKSTRKNWLWRLLMNKPPYFFFFKFFFYSVTLEKEMTKFQCNDGLYFRLWSLSSGLGGYLHCGCDFDCRYEIKTLKWLTKQSFHFEFSWFRKCWKISQFLEYFTRLHLHWLLINLVHIYYLFIIKSCGLFTFKKLN